MKKVYTLLILGINLVFSCENTSSTLAISNKKILIQEQSDSIPKLLQKIVAAYPAQSFVVTPNYLIWKDGTKMKFDDGIINKKFEILLNKPDLQDQMELVYNQNIKLDTPKINSDPGRIRFLPFFMKMYGSTRKEVEANLTTILFCGQKVRVSTINNVHEKLKKISTELEKEKKWAKYLENIGGTFNWRKIAGTERMSMHSFGITIDINVKYANYWRWNVANKKENGKRPILYKNKIPLKLVQIFEKYGFIWGGKWYHYDTMHFEYRPELLETK